MASLLPRRVTGVMRMLALMGLFVLLVGSAALLVTIGKAFDE
jgi:hypothetical protein